MDLREQMTKKAKTAEPNVASNAALEQPHQPSLAHPDAIDNFVAQMKAVEAGWNAKSDDEKIAHFQTLISEKFAAAGMPAPTISKMDAGGGRNGEFDAASWGLKMAPATLAKPMAEVAGTVYHESRHAQQFFMIAQYIAKSKIAPPPHQQIPAAILEAAARAEANPASRLLAPEEDEAKLYHTSMYGTGLKKRNHTLTTLGTAMTQLTTAMSELQAAKVTEATTLATFKNYKNAQGEEFQKSPDVRKADVTHVKNYDIKEEAKARRIEAGAALIAKSDAFKAVEVAYRALPEEADAFRAGDAVSAKLRPSASAPAAIDTAAAQAEPGQG
ncbi:hypothetical protein IV454_12780 [Massilia antarctica]|uniref:Uncharacterized protein n=1 Tax=Massilia antarctica TaxID=2765360 RepID=A0AA49AAH5_9BURK|nr:hypothetical protein [Massilia antarctica]QPI52276.1 hypothetical protein IV454_12780 [Massilia antarctica]